jgi:hypothetical protein
MKYLPTEFHDKSSFKHFMKLPREDWHAMKPDHAALVVLSMGLALRDIAMVHFHEDGDYADDVPDWVQSSPFHMQDAHKLLEIWKRQLPAEDASEEEEPQDDIKGKGKATAAVKGGKRRAKSPIPNPEVNPPA